MPTIITYPQTTTSARAKALFNLLLHFTCSGGIGLGKGLHATRLILNLLLFARSSLLAGNIQAGQPRQPDIMLTI